MGVLSGRPSVQSHGWPRRQENSARRAPLRVAPRPASCSARPGSRWAGGWAIPLVAAASMSGGRGRGEVRRRSAPVVPGRWVCRRGLLPSLARAAGHAGRVSVVVSELGRLINDQAAATYFFGFVSSPYRGRTWETRCHCCSPFVAGSGHSSVVHSITRRRLGLAVCHLEWHAPRNPPLRSAPRCGNSPTHRPLTGPEARVAGPV